MSPSVPLANPENIHDAGNFSSDEGSVTGYTVTSNNNINRNAPPKAATAGLQGGSRKKRKRRSRKKRKSRSRKRRRKRVHPQTRHDRGGLFDKPEFTGTDAALTLFATPIEIGKQAWQRHKGEKSIFGSTRRRKRGGGYGFNPKGTPRFGVMPIEVTNNCGVDKQPDLNIAKQHVGSPPPQRGGGKSGCGGCGGTPYYGFTKAIPGLYNYAPVTAECHKQCGGKRGGRRRSRRRRKRGGYAQFGGNIPSTPGYATPNGGNWKTATPPTYARNDACGTGNCVDNYNHFTGKGAPSPVLDGAVFPPPPLTQIKTPNNTAQCGGRRRKRRRRKRTRRPHRRRKKHKTFRRAAGH